jgi:hypothetical protein
MIEHQEAEQREAAEETDDAIERAATATNGPATPGFGCVHTTSPRAPAKSAA